VKTARLLEFFPSIEKSKQSAREELLPDIEESRLDSMSSESSADEGDAYYTLHNNDENPMGENQDFFNFDDYLQATYDSNYRRFEQEALERNAMVDTYNFNPSSKWQQQYLHAQRQELLNNQLGQLLNIFQG
jgi:hypothetical protein